MVERNEKLWTIDELGEAVATALAVDYEGAPSGRVRDVPDRRTIRYYTTLGLIDRPKEMRGRTALYDRKHLLQLVAIKRLQARGLTLAEVQAELAGANTKALKAMASIADDASFETMSSITEETGRRSEAFWGSLPADDVAGGEDEQDEIQRQIGVEESTEKTPSGALLGGVRLGDDVVLLLAPKRAIDGDDVRALEEASRPLVRLLRQRGLI